MPTKKKGQRRTAAAKSSKPARRRDVARAAGTRKSKARAARSSTALVPTPNVVSVTPTEHAIITKNRKREGSRPAPSVKVVTVEGREQITIDHQNAWVGGVLLMNALGTTSPDFLGGLLGQLTMLAGQGAKIGELELNFMLATIKGIAPRDEMEAMLAAQMVAVHNATMATARQLMDGRGAEQDLASTRLNKLARTYATQVEALKKYRSGGKQTIKVQHVTVNNEGGQAIVGNIAPGGSGAVAKSEDQCHAIAFAPGTALRSEDEARELVPSPCDAERPLPDARRHGGSAQG